MGVVAGGVEDAPADEVVLEEEEQEEWEGVVVAVRAVGQTACR